MNTRWRRTAELILNQADVAAVSRQVHLALFYNAQLDIGAMGALSLAAERTISAFLTGWERSMRCEIGVLLLAVLGASAALAQTQNIPPPPPVVLLPQTSIANACTLGCDSSAMFCLNTCVQPPLLRRRPINNAVSVALRRSSSASNGANGRPSARQILR